MLESWRGNSVCSEIFFGFQQTDPKLGENIAQAKALDRPYFLFENIGLVAKTNALYEEARKTKDYDAYVVLNDDFVIQTPRWDALILERLARLHKQSGHNFWIPIWRDGINDHRLAPSFATRDLAEAIGGYFPRGYMRHLYVDKLYHHIGSQCGLLVYMSDIFIEHRHYSVGKADLDANYRESNSSEAYGRDKTEYKRWLIEQAPLIVGEIRGAIAKTASTSVGFHAVYLITLPSPTAGGFEDGPVGVAYASQSDPCIQLRADQDNERSKSLSVRKDIIPNCWQTIRFECIERLSTDTGYRLQMGPVHTAMVLALSSIRIVRASDNGVIYSADSEAEFGKIKITGEMLARYHGSNLLLFAAGQNPQMRLPPFDLRAGESYALEIIFKWEIDDLFNNLKLEIQNLKRIVDSAQLWQKRSWIKRAFHHWRIPDVEEGKVGVLKRLERSVRKRRKQIMDKN